MCLVTWSRLCCIVKIPTTQEWVSWPEVKFQLGSLWCCRWNPGEYSDCPLWHTYCWTMLCNTDCKMPIPILSWQLHRYCDLWCSIPSTRLQIVKAFSFLRGWHQEGSETWARELFILLMFFLSKTYCAEAQLITEALLIWHWTLVLMTWLPPPSQFGKGDADFDVIYGQKFRQ